MTPEETRQLLRAAAGLFNEGKYLAAHEVLDELWEGTQGPDADFYKGLIQAAVALHHLGEGNLEGATRLHRGARRLLGTYLPEHRGIDVGAFLEALSGTLRGSVRGEALSPPRIELPEVG